MTTHSRLLQGSTVAPEIDWEAILMDQLPRIYNFFRFRVGEGMEAEDLAAATVEKAWRSRQQYQSTRAAISTWLFTIARRVAIDYYRKHRPEIGLAAVADQVGDESPEETAEYHLDQAHLVTLLAQLPGRERELLALKYGAEMTNREIAKLVGLSESNVGTILSRVVHKLRREWEARL